MPNIKRILVEGGSEPCEVDVSVMHKSLLQLPAEKYLELYRMMQVEMGDRDLTYFNIDSHELYESVIEEAKLTQCKTGKNPFSI